ncbi:hypothetical protein [Mucilaginibacter sp.]|uniref:hypothetical protein n=1 Tax=Mucilaginibacter sp. TaxID=1882438 RepID=UPI00326455B3
MKKFLFITALFFSVNGAFANLPVCYHRNVLKISTKHIVKNNVAECQATGTIGTGANKITFTATAPTCKEAIAMVKAALE